MPSNNRPYSVFLFLKPRPKKVALFPEIGRANIFYHLRARMFEIVSEYIFFVSEQKRKKKHRHTNKQK